MSDDEKYDAFGRPIEQRDEEEQAPVPEAAPASGGFLPPTEQREEEEPAGPGGFLPPTDQPPERESWWADPAAAAPPAWAEPAGPGAAQGELAEYRERVGAAVLDFLIRMAIAIAIGVVVGVAASDADAGGTGFVLALWLVTPFYAPILMTRWEGQTIGHRATNTRIVSKNGAPVTGGKAFTREVLAKTLLIEVIGAFVTVGILALVNYLWPLWDDKNEALHDKMCDTRVVKA